MYTLKGLFKTASSCQTNISGQWVPCRPVNHTVRTLRQRIREALAVFTGKADCFTWPMGQ